MRAAIPDQNVGQAMHRLIAELYPICRSITGNGLRETLRIVARAVSLQLHEVPSGKRVLDWIVPKEWNIEDAWVKSSRGERLIDFQKHNLHVMSYSVPVRRTMSLAELKPHLFSLPERPDWIPYRTSYYKEDWAFCLSDRQLSALNEDTYDVCIDSSLTDGSLTYGECFLSGDSAEEVLISTHVCHPSLANDNLSGITLAAFLARTLSQMKRRYSYRFLFIPGTIGSIAWLALNPDAASRVKHGLVLAGVGDAGHITYKKSRRGDAEIDRAVEQVLKQSGAPHTIEDFSPYGYDERQYCSPGFNLAVGCLSRTPFSRYPQYHSSADDMDFVKVESLADSYSTCLQIFEVLEHNRRYINLNPKGEPQLGKRGLYDSVGGHSDAKSFQLAMLWLLNLSDGGADLLDIAVRAGLPFGIIRDAASELVRAELLQEAAGPCASLRETM